ncbi:MarR family transcriptional regulator [Bradyrhizobium sp. 190]|uniref:MarR family winged helix-turn-helix transcriptional regulator n=1 Tax=Bradyrhizobium sp. 190 TaxID=2782658 RepID=UPI001FF85BF6|nr:MarR family transcriptional regulator [Bradyrhizobium sp. 190]MCK1513186.1 MarR family transcriptional regulator [Bradyrhizobium sp. 190]
MSAMRKNKIRQREIENLDIIKRFTLQISSINCRLGEVRQIWAKTLGISGPQWMILIAISDLEKDGGVPVKVVSKLLHVDPSFVTTQSKRLEQKGLLRRLSSPIDGRVVQMSLTEKTRKNLASLDAQYGAIKEFVFKEFDEKELIVFSTKLATLDNRLEKACLKLASDFDF